jgi:hypothetical protein
MPMLAQCFQKPLPSRTRRVLPIQTPFCVSTQLVFNSRQVSRFRKLSATVAPGAQTTFTVSVDTSVAGPRWGTFSFATSDSDENPFVLNFTADVLSMAPEIDIRNEATGQSLLDGSGSINFGSAELATPVQRSIRISNYGRTALNLGVPTVGSGFARCLRRAVDPASKLFGGRNPCN